MRQKQLSWTESQWNKSAKVGPDVVEAYPLPACLEEDLLDDLGVHLDKKNEHGENFRCDEDDEVLEERAPQERTEHQI